MRGKSIKKKAIKFFLFLGLCYIALIQYLVLFDLFKIFCPLPESLFNVERTLKRSLTIGFTHTSTDHGRSGKYKRNTYHFEDENGVVFKVSSSHVNGTPFPDLYTTCSYPKDLLKASEQPLKDVFDSIPSLKWEVYKAGGNYKITIDHKQDLGLAASGVSKAIQAVSPFPIDRNKYRFVLPHIEVSIQYVSAWSGESAEDTLTHFAFLCEGEEVAAEEQILEELQRSYDEWAEKHKILE